MKSCTSNAPKVQSMIRWFLSTSRTGGGRCYRVSCFHFMYGVEKRLAIRYTLRRVNIVGEKLCPS